MAQMLPRDNPNKLVTSKISKPITPCEMRNVKTENIWLGEKLKVIKGLSSMKENFGGKAQNGIK